MPILRVYSRHGCHLCEILIEELVPIVRGHMEVEVCDVDTRPDWFEKYDIRVPLVEYEGEPVCKYYLDRRAISALLRSLSEESGE